MFLAAAAAKSLQSCPTLWDPTDGSPPGSPVPGILQARTLEWVAISFSNAWKWSRSVVSDPQWPHGLQPSRLLHPWDFPGRSTGVGCHCLFLATALYFPFCCAVLSHFSCVWLFVTLWTVAHQAPLSMDSPGKSTGIGCHALLQEIFLTQGSNPCLLHLPHGRHGLYH